MDYEKSPVAHVWGRRIRSMRRSITPFDFVDRYDPNEACKHKFHDFKSYRKFFWGRQSPVTLSNTPPFWVIYADQVIINFEK